jgi:hypothetical protein
VSLLKSAVNIAVISAWLFNLQTALWAGANKRPLFNEGVHWFFHLLDSGKMFRDTTYLRYSDLLPQLPTYLTLLVFGHVTSIRSALNIFCFSYALQPFALLSISIALLFLYKRREWIPLVLISFALDVQSTAEAAQTIVFQSIGFFWILLVALLFGSSGKWNQLFWQIPILLILVLSHESSIFLVAFLGAVAVARAHNFTDRRTFFAYAVLCGIACLYLSYRVLNGYPSDSRWFQLAFKAPWGKYRWYSFWATLVTVVAAIAMQRWRAHQRQVAAFAAMSFLLLSSWIFVTMTKESIWQAVAARTTAIFLVLPLAILMVVFELRKIKIRRPMLMSLKVFAALALAVSARYDLLLSNSWAVGFTSLVKTISEMPHGCSVIPGYKSLLWANHDISLDRLGMFSLVLQNTHQPNVILFAGAIFPKSNPCKIFDEKREILMGEFLGLSFSETGLLHWDAGPTVKTKL